MPFMMPFQKIINKSNPFKNCIRELIFKTFDQYEIFDKMDNHILMDLLIEY